MSSSTFPVTQPIGRPPAWTAREIGLHRAHVEAVSAELATLDPPGQTAPVPDRVLMVIALIEAIETIRWEFDAIDHDGELRRAYEVFRMQLERHGFHARWAHRRDRAIAHRRLGELAEARGDVIAALWHYDLAVRAWRDVGCRRRRDALAREARR